MANDNLVNFYEEITSCCKVKDIDYIVTKVDKWADNERYVKIDKDWFLEQAKRIQYDPSFGDHVIDLELRIVLKDGSWLEREEYDGAENFVLKGKPPCPEEELEKDVGNLLDERHGCTYNETLIDEIPINGKYKSGDYSMWFEKDGKIVTESFSYVNGNYRSEHEKLLK